MRLDGYYVLMDTCPDRESAGEFPRLSREESLTRLFPPPLMASFDVHVFMSTHIC